jgi:hypothetical protein
MRTAAASLVLACITGCASTDVPQPPTQVAAATASTPAGPAPQQVCHKERPTGSLMLVTVCEPALSEEERRRQVDDAQRTIRQQNRPTPVSGGG